MKTPSSESELRDLFSRICDQTATREEWEWLEMALKKDARIRWSYLEYTAVESAIPQLVRQEKAEATAEPDGSLVELVLVEEAFVEKKSSEAPVSFPTFSRLAGTIDWRVHPVRFMAVVLALTFAVWCVPIAVVQITEKLNSQPETSPMLINPPAERSVLRDPHQFGFAATLLKTSDARWDSEFQELLDSGDSTSRKIATGQQVELEEGLALFEFSSGARIAIEGPASFTFTGFNSGSLDVGELTAIVNEASRGFTIKTPKAIVRDLGTEFGLRVSDDGSGDVFVFKGTVELESDNLDAPALRLTAGKAAGLDGTVQDGLALSDEFARKRDFLTGQQQRSLDSKDETIMLTAGMAKISGDALRYDANSKSLGHWINSQAYPSWEFNIEANGQYSVVLEFGCPDEEAGSRYSIEIDGEVLGERVKTESTGGWTTFAKKQIGQVDLAQGKHTLVIRNYKERNIGKGLMDIRSVAFKRLAEPGEK